MATVAFSNALARRLAIEAAEREAVNETEAASSRVEDLLHSIEERTLALGEALSVLSPEPKVRLSRLDAIVQQIELGRSGFGLVLSRSGVVIAVSRRDERVRPGAPLLEQTNPASRAALEPIVGRIERGERGFVPIQLERGAFRLTWRPLGPRRCSRLPRSARTTRA